VTSIAAPVASGWSVCRVGFAPTGKRRLSTAHAISRHSNQSHPRITLRCFVQQKPRREAGATLIVAQEQGDSKGEGVLKDYVLALLALPAARLLVCAQCSTPTRSSRPSR